MAAIWAVAELAGGRPTRLSLELATLARQLAQASGGTATVVAVGSGAAGAAKELAALGPRVIAVEAPTEGDRPAASVVAPRLAALAGEARPDVLLVPASPDGKDVAGFLSALLELPVLVSAAGVRWADGGPVVQMSTFGGRLGTESAFTHGRGIILVRPGTATAEPALRHVVHARGDDEISHGLSQVAEQVGGTLLAEEAAEQTEDDVHGRRQHAERGHEQIEIQIQLADDGAPLFAAARAAGGHLRPPPRQQPHRQPRQESGREPGQLLAQIRAEEAFGQRADEHADLAAQPNQHGRQADGRDQIEIQAAQAGLARRFAGQRFIAAQGARVVGPQDRHPDDARVHELDVVDARRHLADDAGEADQH